jgi:hypothetical protein
MELEERAPYLMVPVGQCLTQPRTHNVKKEVGTTANIITKDGLPQGCPSAPWAFSFAMANLEDDLYRIIAEARVNPKAARLNRYMDDLTLATAPEASDKCFEVLRDTLPEAGLKLDEEHVRRGPPMAAHQRRHVLTHSGARPRTTDPSSCAVSQPPSNIPKARRQRLSPWETQPISTTS